MTFIDQQKAQEEADLSIWFRSTPEEPKTGFIQGNTFDLKEVKYSAIEGIAIFEGDIALSSVEKMEAFAEHVAAGDVESGVGITGTQFRWPNGIVPYEIDPALPNQQRVTDAIQHWEHHTPIRLPLRTAANATQFPNYIRFVDRNACWSSVGMQGGMQEISLGNGCSTGSAIHEIGHAVGLWHEQSREDRDLFVRILFANIEDQMRHNFNQHITDGDDIGAYDYDSIMHYPTHAFSKNEQPTIEPIGGQAIGQRTGLSAGDIAAVRAMYPLLREFTDASGNPVLLQGRFGQQGNFELVVPRPDTGLSFCWRNNDDPSFPWSGPFTFGMEAGRVEAVTMIQGNFSSPGNLELIARVGDRLAFFWRDSGPSFTWSGPFFFASGASGNPVLIQGRFGQQGNFELVVPRPDAGMDFYWRNNDDPSFPWSGPFAFGMEAGRVEAVTMIQGNFGSPGNLELIARVGDRLAFFWRDSGPSFTWSGPFFL